MGLFLFANTIVAFVVAWLVRSAKWDTKVFALKGISIFGLAVAIPCAVYIHYFFPAWAAHYAFVVERYPFLPWVLAAVQCSGLLLGLGGGLVVGRKAFFGGLGGAAVVALVGAFLFRSRLWWVAATPEDFENDLVRSLAEEKLGFVLLAMAVMYCVGVGHFLWELHVNLDEQR